LLALGPALRAVAAAAQCARDDGGTPRLFGAPVGGVVRRIETTAEDGVEFDNAVLLHAPHQEMPTGVTKAQRHWTSVSARQRVSSAVTTGLPRTASHQRSSVGCAGARGLP
jgi:hypothetical protein